MYVIAIKEFYPQNFKMFECEFRDVIEQLACRTQYNFFVLSDDIRSIERTSDFLHSSRIEIFYPEYLRQLGVNAVAMKSIKLREFNERLGLCTFGFFGKYNVLKDQLKLEVAREFRSYVRKFYRCPNVGEIADFLKLVSRDPGVLMDSFSIRTDCINTCSLYIEDPTHEIVDVKVSTFPMSLLEIVSVSRLLEFVQRQIIDNKYNIVSELEEIYERECY